MLKWGVIREAIEVLIIVFLYFAYNQQCARTAWPATAAATGMRTCNIREAEN